MIDLPLVHPNVFKSNPLIAHLASDPWWTVSDNDKRPLDAKKLLATNDVDLARLDGDHPLVTLDALDANTNLDAVNRAYRLRARENRVIAIDVEPHAEENVKNDVFAFPAHYTELSKNGGVHLLIRVPDDCINDENRYMFDDLSVFKEPVPKDSERKSGYEVIFNDHYITFTKKMHTTKPCIDYAQDPVAKDKLIQFLDNIVRLDRDKKQERENAKKYRIQMLNDSVSEEHRALIDQLFELPPIEIAREEATAKTLDEFNGDVSRYEISIAGTYAHHVIRARHLARGTIHFSSMANKLTDHDLIYATYLLLADTVPYRAKHDEDREGLPWLLYSAKRAYEYRLSKTKKK